ISAGEVCSEGLVRNLSGGRHFINAYGPTEVTVCASLTLCTERDGQPRIGRPIGNVQIHLLDAGMEPVPAGVRGEIFIGGEGLARGYVQRADLTAERFLPNAFARPGTRLYRTGD